MRNRPVLVSAVTAAIVVMTSWLDAQQAPPRPGAAPSIEERTNGLRKIDGYFPLYWDERSGSMLLEIPRLDAEFLFSTGLSAGLGSNDIGLDRGAGRRRTRRPVRARRPARDARAAEPVVPIEQRQSAGAQVGGRLVREVDALGLHASRPRRAGVCWWMRRRSFFAI